MACTNEGKHQRLREHGIWLMEEESYCTEGNFLHITDAPEGYARIIRPYSAQPGIEELLLMYVLLTNFYQQKVD